MRMKIRHNKKRNTAFVYESLIREATLCILKNNPSRKQKVLSIIKEHFKRGTTLRQDLDCYQSLYPNQGVSELEAVRILKEARNFRQTMNSSRLFKEQTAVIDLINKQLGSDVFSNFVPNYKTLASISQLFGDKTTPKTKVLLENKLVNEMMVTPKKNLHNPQIDKTVYKIFVNKFNEKYNSQLLPEQKQLLNYYVSSFSDNALSLKIFLNEEVGRLKSELKKSINIEEIKNDSQMQAKTKQIIEKLEGFKATVIDETVLLSILKTQQLVKEIKSDAD